MPSNEERVAELMDGYVPTNADADEIAETIAADGSLNAVLTKEQRLQLVRGLFDGDTGEAEEDAAVSILRTASITDLRWLIGQIGWDELEDELDEEDIGLLRGLSGDLTGFIYTDNNSDEIASRIAGEPSLLANLSSEQKVRLVRALLDGQTTEEEEDDVMTILRSMSVARLRFAVQQLGLQNLRGELDHDDIVEVLTLTLDFSEFNPADLDSAGIAMDIAQNSAALAAMSREGRAKLVKALFYGNTNDAEENAALTILLSESSGEGLIHLVCDVGGWEVLASELKTDAINSVTQAITDSLDVDNAVLRQDELRPEMMPWLYDQQLELFASPFGPSMQAIVDALSADQKLTLLNFIINRRESLLWQIASLRRRDKTFPIDAFETVLGWLHDSLADPTSLTAVQSARLRHEVRYMHDLALNLAEADYGQLINYLPDMVDDGLPAEQRLALFEVLRKLEPEFAAQKQAVASPDLGTPDQRSRLQRFHNYLNTFLETFDPNLPSQTLLEQLISALQELGEQISGALDELREAVSILANDVLDQLALSEILGTNDDDRARQLIGLLSSQQENGTSRLARLSFHFKDTLIRACLGGFAGDEDEDAILLVLDATDEMERAEFFQLIHSIGFEALASSMDGDQWVSFMALFACGEERVGTTGGRLVVITESPTGMNELLRDTWTSRVYAREELCDAIQSGEFLGYRVRIK